MDATFDERPGHAAGASDSDATTSGRVPMRPMRPSKAGGRAGRDSVGGSNGRSRAHRPTGSGSGSARGRNRPSGGSTSLGSSTELDRAVEDVSHEVRAMIPQLQALRQRYNQVLMQQAGQAGQPQAPLSQPQPHLESTKPPTRSAGVAPSPQPPLTLPLAAVNKADDGKAAQPSRASKRKLHLQGLEAAGASHPGPSSAGPSIASPSVKRTIPCALLQDITAAAAVVAAAAVAADGQAGLSEDTAEEGAEAGAATAAMHLAQLCHGAAALGRHVSGGGAGAGAGAAGSYPYGLLPYQPSPHGDLNPDAKQPEDPMDPEEAADLFADLDSPHPGRLTPFAAAAGFERPLTPTIVYMPEAWQAQSSPVLGRPYGPCGGAIQSVAEAPTLGGLACAAAAVAAPSYPARAAGPEFQGSVSSALQSSISSTVPLRRELSTTDSDEDERVLPFAAPMAAGAVLGHPLLDGAGCGIQRLPARPLLTQLGLSASWDAELVYPGELALPPLPPQGAWDAQPAMYADLHGFSAGMHSGTAGDCGMYEYAYIDVTLIDPDEM